MHHEALEVFLSEAVWTIGAPALEDPDFELEDWLSRKAKSHLHAFRRVKIRMFQHPERGVAYDMLTFVRGCFPNPATRISLETKHDILDPAGDLTSLYVANAFLRREAFEIPLWVDIATTRRAARNFVDHWDERIKQAEGIIPAAEHKARKGNWEKSVESLWRMIDEIEEGQRHST